MPGGVQSELTRMRVILEDLELKLESGQVPTEALSDFKSAVDEIRLRVWSLLTAAGAEDSRSTAERFRLKRAAELCRSLAHELAAGRLGPDHPEWPELQQTAVRLTAVIGEHTGHAA